jgi:hypothetical protein
LSPISWSLARTDLSNIVGDLGSIDFATRIADLINTIGVSAGSLRSLGGPLRSI